MELEQLPLDALQELGVLQPIENHYLIGTASMQSYECGELSFECHLVGNNPEAGPPGYKFAVDRGRLADRPLSRTAARELIESFSAARVMEQFRYLNLLRPGRRGQPGGPVQKPRTCTGPPNTTSSTQSACTTTPPTMRVA
jgi:hypothetical protein